MVGITYILISFKFSLHAGSGFAKAPDLGTNLGNVVVSRSQTTFSRRALSEALSLFPSE